MYFQQPGLPYSVSADFDVLTNWEIIDSLTASASTAGIKMDVEIKSEELKGNRSYNFVSTASLKCNVGR